MDRALKKEEAAAPAEKKFLSGVGILSVATLISKVIGLFYRIPLVAAIGISGMAYYLAANHLYVTLYLVVSSGLPMAVSILVSESRAQRDFHGAERLFRAVLFAFLSFGILGSAFLFFGAGFLGDRISLPGAEWALRVIAPTLLFSSISAALRGYFQGCERMRETAVSEVIESAGKLVFGLFFASLLVRRGAAASFSAAGASLGITVGSLFSMLYLAFSRRHASLERLEKPAGVAGTLPLRKLWHIAAPVTMSAVVMGVGSAMDTMLIPRRLAAAGFSAEMAETMYSSYGNLALPMFNLPASMITPVALALIPLLSSARSRVEGGAEAAGIVASALRLTALLALPASVGLSVFAGPILQLFYPSVPSAVAIASPLLSVLAISVLLSCLMTVTNAILSTYGGAGKAFFSMSLGVFLKIVLEYVLVGIPSVHVFGAPISTFCCNLTVVLCNFGFMARYVRRLPSVGSVFLLPLTAAGIAVGGAAVGYLILYSVGGFSAWKVLLSVALAAVGYLLLAWYLGALKKEDVSAVLKDRMPSLPRRNL